MLFCFFYKKKQQTNKNANYTQTQVSAFVRIGTCWTENLLQPVDVTQDSKEHQNAKRQQKKATHRRASDKQNA